MTMSAVDVTVPWYDVNTGITPNNTQQHHNNTNTTWSTSTPYNVTGLTGDVTSVWNHVARDVTSSGVTPRWALLGLVVVPTWILCGNLLVLLAVMWNRNLRSFSNYVIASLAATDFMLALTVVPLGTYQVVSGHGFYTLASSMSI